MSEGSESHSDINTELKFTGDDNEKEDKSSVSAEKSNASFSDESAKESEKDNEESKDSEESIDSSSGSEEDESDSDDNEEKEDKDEDDEDNEDESDEYKESSSDNGSSSRSYSGSSYSDNCSGSDYSTYNDYKKWTDDRMESIYKNSTGKPLNFSSSFQKDDFLLNKTNNKYYKVLKVNNESGNWNMSVMEVDLEEEEKKKKEKKEKKNKDKNTKKNEKKDKRKSFSKYEKKLFKDEEDVGFVGFSDLFEEEEETKGTAEGKKGKKNNQIEAEKDDKNEEKTDENINDKELNEGENKINDENEEKNGVKKGVENEENKEQKNNDESAKVQSNVECADEMNNEKGKDNKIIDNKECVDKVKDEDKKDTNIESEIKEGDDNTLGKSNENNEDITEANKTNKEEKDEKKNDESTKNNDRKENSKYKKTTKENKKKNKEKLNKKASKKEVKSSNKNNNKEKDNSKKNKKDQKQKEKTTKITLKNYRDFTPYKQIAIYYTNYLNTKKTFYYNININFNLKAFKEYFQTIYHMNFNDHRINNDGLDIIFRGKKLKKKSDNDRIFSPLKFNYKNDYIFILEKEQKKDCSIDTGSRTEWMYCEKEHVLHIFMSPNFNLMVTELMISKKYDYIECEIYEIKRGEFTLKAKMGPSAVKAVNDFFRSQWKTKVKFITKVTSSASKKSDNYRAKNFVLNQELFMKRGVFYVLDIKGINKKMDMFSKFNDEGKYFLQAQDNLGVCAGMMFKLISDLVAEEYEN